MTVAVHSVVVAWLFLSLTGSVTAGEYADPSGFALTYPDDGWMLVTAAQLADPQLQPPPDLRAWLDQHQVDLRRIAAAVVRIGRDEFTEVVSVVVNDQQLPATDAAAKVIADRLIAEYAKHKATVHDFRIRVERIGDRNAVVCDAVTSFDDDPARQHERQVFYPGGGRTFVVTCSAPENTFEQHRPTFEAMLADFRAPAPKHQGIDPLGIATTAAVCGVAGAVIGGLITLFRKLFGQRSASGATAS